MSQPLTTDQQALVVVGCDGSPAAQPAVDFAVREAVLRGARLLVVAVWSFPVYAFPLAVVMVDDDSPGLAAAAEAAARTALDNALQRAGHPDLVCTVEVHQGRPADVLLQCADNAQLLVVGARGLGVWGRMALGSTSTEVVHHATVPVAVVRDEQVQPVEPKHQHSVATRSTDSRPVLVGT